MAVLYTKPSAALETPLIDLLPPNLVGLALHEWWWPDAELADLLPDWEAQDRERHYQARHYHRVVVLRTLIRFACEFRKRLRNLKKVILVCNIRWTWVLEGVVPLDFHFEDVKATFLAQGVEFLVR